MVKRLESMDFTELIIYQQAEELTVEIYELTKKFPKEERYGLTDQLRRAIVSVCANIAEGSGRYHYKDRLNFFYNARGSLFEIRSLLSLCFKIGFINEEDLKSLEDKLKDLQVKLHNFITSTRRRVNK